MIYVFWTVHRQELNMTEQCVIHAGNNQFMEYVGNVLSAIIMIYAQSAIILISIICVIDFIGSRKDMSHCGILKEFCKQKKTKNFVVLLPGRRVYVT